ncbi:hypothetical protein [Falsiroseomonas sp. E2-1-a4]|uniref:hypothetical protein n=1 Tax=Falsiroseomonas sp. E2-1-a4 TaxID=3239299 RepID=UPI003F3708F8
MTMRLDRPRFFEGQFLGAADLEATVGHARDLSREHLLAAHPWGIATGLELVEAAAAGGGGAADYFIMPGLAWDGYGRAALVLSPVQVPSALFTGLADGDHMVWLRYDEAPLRGLREGFGACGVDEAFARIRESFAIEAGPFIRVADRQGGVSVAGVTVPDARLVPHEFDPAAAVLGDGSVPHQTFPDDAARWLIPIGVATWVNGAPGVLKSRSAASLQQSRVVRQMLGTVTESVFAADGVIRLRDRFTSLKANETADLAMAAQAIKTTDLLNAPDPDDSTKTLARIINRELVWVEGNLRATGQVRLFGTRLELRDANGAEAGGAALYARRAVSANNPAGGQDFQIILGGQSDGKDRLAIGTAVAYGPISERFVLRNDGVLAAGRAIPNDLKTTHALFCQPDGIAAALAVNAGRVARFCFQLLPALTEAAHLAYDDAPKKLRLGVGTDLANFTTWTSAGQVGIRTDAPEAVHPDGSGLVVKSAANPGLTLLGAANTQGSIHFADGVAGAAEQRAGFIRYNHPLDRLHFGTQDALRMTLDAQGDLGLGTDAPTARIHVVEGAAALKLSGDAVQAENGGAVARLELQRGGGGLRVNGNAADANRFALTADGRLGIGTDAPFSPLTIRKTQPEIFLDVIGGGPSARIEFAVAAGVQSTITHNAADRALRLSNEGSATLTLRQGRLGVNLGGSGLPQVPLHVRGTISGDANQIASHVALIENTAGGGADVLALRISGTAASAQNNFITFFDQNGPVGRIERSGLADIQSGDINQNQASAGNVLRLISGGADFAECLRRESSVAPIGPGRIVGVRNGAVSLVTAGADAVLVTTDRAVVVGNASMAGDAAVETVALIGQVLLSVHGPAASGDVILPSGQADGMGRAVAPGRLTVAEAGQVVGRAWADKRSEGPGAVLVAVGMQGADGMAALSAAVAAQAAEIEALRRSLAQLHAGEA